MRLRGLRMALIAGGCLIAGLIVGMTIPRAARPAYSRLDDNRRLDRSTSQLSGRNIFSPDFRHDEYVRREQLKIVEKLEQQCRVDRDRCELAKTSRKALTKD